MTYRITKRMLDVLLAGGLLLLTWPVALGIGLVGLVAFRGRPLFSQLRIGKGERPFRLWKFRSMRPGAGADADRLTSWGMLLRKMHLDEWPQLLHIVWGQMSLVGPRPLLPEYLPIYTEAERARHLVVPGIMGLAQAKGGNALPWRQRLRYDAWYARHHSLFFDLYLMISTLTKARNFTQSPLFSERLDQHRID